MVQLTRVILTCDVHDGDGEAVETVGFTVGGHLPHAAYDAVH